MLKAETQCTFIQVMGLKVWRCVLFCQKLMKDAENKMTIYLIRHGQTIWNTRQRMQGQLDSPLTSLGTRQAKNIGKCLKSRIETDSILTIFSSPLGRTLKTAAIICDELGWNSDSIIPETALMEANHGSWSGWTKSDIRRVRPVEFHERKNNHWHFRFPQGESYADLSRRAEKWCRKVIDHESTILAITHEMMSRCIRGYYSGLDSENTLKLSHSHNQIFVLERGSIEVLSLPQ